MYSVSDEDCFQSLEDLDDCSSLEVCLMIGMQNLVSLGKNMVFIFMLSSWHGEM